MKTWQQLAISVGLGIGIGGAVGYLAKRHYEDLFCKELDKVEVDFLKRINREIEARNFAYREVFELREALRIMVDEMQYETILEQVKYKMREMDEKYPECRKKLENSGWIVSKFTARGEDQKTAVKMAEDLGYSQAGSKYAENFAVGLTNLKKQCDDLRDDIVTKQNAFAEQALAEAEHPMDDGEEFTDWPPLAPNGDILDEGWSAEAEISDETPFSETMLVPDGDDIVRDEPYLITEFQFTYGKKDYDKVSVSYLSKDDTVLDTDDTELDQKFIGPDNLKAFEETDCPSIFIRNDELEIDYEIMWEDMSYTHDRLGYPEAEVSGQRIWRRWDKEDD